MALPIIETPRLRLRPRRMADLDACLDLDRSLGTADWLDLPIDRPAAHEAFVKARIRGPYPAGQGYWVIARAEHPEEFLGWVLLIPEDATGPRTEIGWRVLPEARGRGYAPEAAANLLAHGFATGLTRVVAEIHRENHASRRVAEKIGMVVAEDPMKNTPHCLLYHATIACAAKRL